MASISIKKHSERRLFKYSAEQIYNVVADINNYSKFVPWCSNSIVLRQEQPSIKESHSIEAELTIGYLLFKESYISVVKCKPYESIVATSNQTNLFEFLKTEWNFQSGKDPSTCWVTFQIDFKFKSDLYNKVSEMFFLDIVHHMVAAFENRAKYLSLSDKKRFLK
jgi:ribosome-associated toxin RatA of RatAB toxin-antitoxin module